MLSSLGGIILWYAKAANSSYSAESCGIIKLVTMQTIR